MIDQLLFQDFLSSLDFGFPIFLMRMPDSPDNAVSFVFTEGLESKGSVNDLLLTVYIRATHPEQAIEAATKLNNELNYKTNFYIGNTQIILVKALTVVPTPLGLDDNDRHVFQLQFKVLSSYSAKTEMA